VLERLPARLWSYAGRARTSTSCAPCTHLTLFRLNGANPDQFVVFFTRDITPKATGQRITLEEVGVYTVKNDKITREQFFYDGAH
jgi:hypothetical protein